MRAHHIATIDTVPMFAIVEASFGAGVTLRPREDKPHHADLSDEHGNRVGDARQCFACAQWLNVFSEAAIGGASNDYMGFWICRGCHISKRALTLTPLNRPVAKALIVPEEYQDAKIGDIMERSVRARAAKWPSKTKLMVIAAPSRSGKTRLTWAYCKEGARQERRVTRLLAPKAMEQWQACADGAERQRLEEQWQRAEYLILDDISACNPVTAPWIRVIHVLLDVRLHESFAKPTLITTAMSKNELGSIYGEAVYNRLNDKDVVWVELPARERLLDGAI